MLLPLDICYYVHGGLTGEEKEVIEEYHHISGEHKWELALSLMNELEFGDPEKFVNVLKILNGNFTIFR